MSGSHSVTDEEILAAKASLTPAMEKQKGRYQCPLGLEMYEVDGVCPNHGIPLRRLPESER